VANLRFSTLISKYLLLFLFSLSVFFLFSDTENLFLFDTQKSTDKDLKNHYINSNKTPINKDKNTYKKRVYNQQEIS